jgi:hypothetical protein
MKCIIVILSILLITNISFAGHMISMPNNNPCTNGTYPKPAGCFQKPDPIQITPNGNGTGHMSGSGLNFDFNRQDVNSIINQAIYQTQQLVDQQKEKTIQQMAETLSNEVVSMFMELGNINSVENNNPGMANHYWTKAESIDLLQLNRCIANKIRNNPGMYDFLVHAPSKRDAMYGVLRDMDSCTWVNLME